MSGISKEDLEEIARLNAVRDDDFWQPEYLEMLDLLNRAIAAHDALAAENAELREAAIAYRKLSTCYRMGKRPGETLFRQLAKADNFMDKPNPPQEESI